MQEENNDKKRLARWFHELDLRETADFKDAEEETLLEQRMAANLRNHIFAPGRAPKRMVPPVWLRGAAAVFFILGCAALIFFLNRTKMAPAEVFYELSTNAGERKTLTLTDGTRIFLNNTGKIKYARQYTGKQRTVYLDGEAFFEVTHNRDKPFIVVSGKIKVNVLGTSFNVSAYHSDPEIAVTVASGKVGVVEKGKSKAWMLDPGQQLSYSKATSAILTRTVKPTDFTGWTDGKLVFNNERMEVICSQLSRSYGVHFNILKPLINNKRISLKIDNENINTIVKILSLTGGFQYNIQGKEIKIW